LQQHLTQAGIGTLIHYPVPPHRQQAYAHLNLAPEAYPLANEIADTCLSLPMWPGMTEEHITAVVMAIKSFFQTT
jgi:dTDP-4-amino-4,6-dideoxygalactose transaminase